MEVIKIKPDNITDVDWKILNELYPNNLKEIIKKLESKYPVQYLIGNVEFCDSIIEVNENVLIPRFETEYFVEKINKKLKIFSQNTLKILDIGTGSGCIIISLAKKNNQYFEAIDISFSALEVAKKNAINNNVNIFFKEKNILKEELDNDFDIIISNPPYVDFNEPVDIAIKYEPQNAIFANKGGLEFYERILKIIKNKPKIIAFEIGMNQGKEIEKMAKEKFPEATISIEKDLTSKNRYIFIENS